MTTDKVFYDSFISGIKLREYLKYYTSAFQLWLEIESSLNFFEEASFCIYSSDFFVYSWSLLYHLKLSVFDVISMYLRGQITVLNLQFNVPCGNNTLVEYLFIAALRSSLFFHVVHTLAANFFSIVGFVQSGFCVISLQLSFF